MNTNDLKKWNVELVFPDQLWYGEKIMVASIYWGLNVCSGLLLLA